MRVRKARLTGLAGLVLSALAVVAGCAWVMPSGTGVGADSASSATSEASARLEQAVLHRLERLSGDYAVTVVELTGAERRVGIRGDEARDPASVIKLFAAYAALDRLERGELTGSTQLRGEVSVDDCLRVMLQISDNPCHWDLVGAMGEAALNEQFAAEGFGATVYPAGYADNRGGPKVTSTNDLADLLVRLAEGELLGAKATTVLVDHLASQIFRQRIAAAVPGSPWVVANKTGQLFVDDDRIEGDAAIVSGPDGSYVLVVLGRGAATTWGVRAIAETVHESLYGDYTPTPPVSGMLDTVRPTSTHSGPDGSVVGALPAGTRLPVLYSQRLWVAVSLSDDEVVWVRDADVRPAVERRDSQ